MVVDCVLTLIHDPGTTQQTIIPKHYDRRKLTKAKGSWDDDIHTIVATRRRTTQKYITHDIHGWVATLAGQSERVREIRRSEQA